MPFPFVSRSTSVPAALLPAASERAGCGLRDYFLLCAGVIGACVCEKASQRMRGVSPYYPQHDVI